MSPVKHSISGAALGFSLQDELHAIHADLAKAPARIGRTLVKDGPLRVTIVGIRPGHGLDEHRAPGPVTIHVLEGEIEVTAAGKTWPLSTGMLLALDAAIPHAVASSQGGVFLLTVVHGGAERRAP